MSRDDRPSNLTRNYSEIAETYDATRFETPSGRFLARTDARIVQELVALSGEVALVDVPVGTGRVLEYLKDLPLDIVGIDATPEMLEVARTRAREERHRLMLGDAANLPFSSGEVNCIISLRFFHLFPTEERYPFAREFSRVLKPGGVLICSFTNGWYGGCINWLKRFLGRQTVYFLRPGELRRLFPGWEVRAVRGNFLPMQWRLARLSHRAETILAWATSRLPLSLFCWERFYLLEKPKARNVLPSTNR